MLKLILCVEFCDRGKRLAMVLTSDFYTHLENICILRQKPHISGNIYALFLKQNVLGKGQAATIAARGVKGVNQGLKVCIKCKIGKVLSLVSIYTSQVKYTSKEQQDFFLSKSIVA